MKGSLKVIARFFILVVLCAIGLAVAFGLAFLIHRLWGRGTSTIVAGPVVGMSFSLTCLGLSKLHDLLKRKGI